MPLMLLLCTIFASAGEQKISSKKEYNKSFVTNRDYTLKIDNKFGSITITHWEKNEVALRVVAEASGNHEKKVQGVLDNIDVNITQKGKIISGVTSAPANKSDNSISFHIDYYISMPCWMNLDLYQKYGNIIIPKTINEGLCNVSIKFGNIEAGSFIKPLNIVSQYGNISIIDAKRATFTMQYSGMTNIRNVDTLKIDSEYSDLKIGEVADLDMESSFGSAKISLVKKARVSLRYADMSVNKVQNVLDISEQSFCKVVVKEVDPAFKSISSESFHGVMTIYVPIDASFNLEAKNFDYGKFRVDKSLNVAREKDNLSSPFYKINGGKGGNIYYDGGSFGSLFIKVMKE